MYVLTGRRTERESADGEVDQIDKKTLEIKPASDQVFTKLLDISDELPEHVPRFILLSYPLTLVRLPNSLSPCPSPFPSYPPIPSLPSPILQSREANKPPQSSGRLSVPYVMLNYLPATSSGEMRMLYAGAKELMRNTAEVGKIIEVETAEEVEEIEGKLKGEA